MQWEKNKKGQTLGSSDVKMQLQKCNNRDAGMDCRVFKQSILDILPYRSDFKLLMEGTSGLPRPDGIYSSSSMFWVLCGAFSNFDIPLRYALKTSQSKDYCSDAKIATAGFLQHKK